MSDVSGSYSTPTGITGAGGGQMLRITGMATGLDVDAMVKKMMLAEQTKVDKIKQDQQLIGWKQQAYQDIIKDIKDLQSTFFDSLNPSNNLLSPSLYNSLSASSTYSSIASATAQTGAATGTYSLNVIQMAQSAVIKSDASFNTQFQVSDIANWSNQSIAFNVGGNTSTINLSALAGTAPTDYSKFISDINNSISKDSNLAGKVSASYVQNGTNSYIKFTPLTSAAVQITGTSVNNDINVGAGITITSASGATKLNSLGNGLNGPITLNLSLNGKPITVNLDNTAGTATINDLITNIKTQTSGQVTGKFDDITGKFILQTASTGSNTSLSLTNNNLSTALKIIGSPSSQGSDAIAQITSPNGTTSIVTENSNNFTINNIAYALNGTGSTSISVTINTKDAHDKIKAFLDKYNAIIDKIQTKLNEKKNYDYPPLTDAQKSSMKDSDITAWNAKAQEGILRNDDNLEKLLADLRSAFTSPVTDAANNPISTLYFGNYGSGAIGIDTPSWGSASSDGDKISIVDDNKLNDAILNHSDDLIKLFTTSVSITDSNNKTSFVSGQSGIMARLGNILNNNVGPTGTSFNNAILTKYANVQDDYTINGGAGSNTLPDQIYYKQLMITKMTDALKTKQEQYYQQFSQLETAMNSLNAQQAQLSQLTG